MKYALTNGYLLDGTKEMSPKEGYTILIDGEQIKDIIKDNSKLDGYEIIDLKGQYVCPGLINMHVHLPSSGKPKKKQTDAKKLVKLLTSNSLFRKLAYNMCKKLASIDLLSGCTTIRTVGGVLDFDSKIRDDFKNGKGIGPRIIAANMAVTVDGGHMAGSVAYPAKDIDDAVKKVQEIAKENPDIIKLMITGGVLDAKVKGEPGVLRMPPEMVKATCDEAHKLGYIVAAHVESPEGVKVALENGVDTIEHGATPTEHIINLFKERKAAHIVTISPALPFALFDRSVSGATELSQYNGDIVFKGIIDCANVCLKNDIPVGLGTDTGCPFITHYDMWREVNYFHKYCSVSKAFALYSATLGNAKIAGIDDITGSIEVGKCADLIVCKSNPLEDLTTLRNLSYVFGRGHMIKNPHIKKFKNVEEELDKYI